MVKIPLAARAHIPPPPPPKVLSAARSAAENKSAAILKAWPTSNYQSWEQFWEANQLAPNPAWLARPFSYAAVLDYLREWRDLSAAAASSVQMTTTTAADLRAMQQLHENVFATGDVKPTAQQRKGANQFINAVFKEKVGRHALCTWKPGDGKSFLCGTIIKWLQDQHYFNQPNPFQTPRVIYVTKNRVVEKTVRTLQRFGVKRISTQDMMGCDVLVTSYSRLMTKRYSMFFQDHSIELYNNQVKTKRFIGTPPVLIVMDESHEVKTWKSKRTQFMWAFHFGDEDRQTAWLSTSATPAVVLNDLMLLACTAGFEYALGEPVTRQNVTAYLQRFGDPTKPSGAVFQKFMKQALGPLHIDVPSGRHAHRVHTRIVEVDFKTERDKQRYMETEEAYIKACQNIGKSVSDEGLRKSMFTIYRRCKESCQVPHFAERALELHAQGYAPIVGVFFQDTVRDVALTWCRAGISRDNICVIWGGEKSIQADEIFQPVDALELRIRGNTYSAIRSSFSSEEQRYTSWEDIQVEIKAEFGEEIDPGDLEFEPANIKAVLNEWIARPMVAKYPEMTTAKVITKWNKTMKYNMDRLKRDESREEAAERRALLKQHGLFATTPEEQQREIDEFQAGKRQFCIFTGASGGTGIDLDHQIEAARPRWMTVTMCYWAEEFVQLLGRDFRIATISDAHHDIMIFRNTIDSHVATILMKKVSAISTIAKRGDDLEEVVARAIRDGKISAQLDAPAEQVSDEVIADDEEDDDEE